MVQLMPLYPKTPSSLASFKSRLVLPFWYWLTEVVLEKRPLNECSVVVVNIHCVTKIPTPVSFFIMKNELNYNKCGMQNSEDIWQLA